MRGRFKMSAKRQMELKAELAVLTDWEGTCQRCGTKRRGTLADLALPCPKCQRGTNGQAAT